MCKVIKVVPENHDINSLYLEVYDEKFKHRKAGQFASLMVMRPDGWSEPHSFSISGAPEESNLRLTIKNVGKFTSAIPDLKQGTSLICKGPFGAFCKDIDMKPSIVLLAGGVGVAPFLSVLRHFRNIKAGNKVVLFWINRSMEDVFSSDEIDAMTNELSLKVVNCLSREDDVQKYFRSNYPEVFYEKGRLSGDILVKFGITKNASFYLCGPLPMMESALVELGNLDVDRSAVQQERFTWDK
ncbi:oxidoreductase, fad/nad-binding family [hydrocarbon metagenome]|uniref:Oxidoreductase, fad/nad-binding family n=1 Tax=hydrocarbon metagenome TaxID=938273 RepID=A0A0W8FN05_9ZZZZ